MTRPDGAPDAPSDAAGLGAELTVDLDASALEALRLEAARLARAHGAEVTRWRVTPAGEEPASG